MPIWEVRSRTERDKERIVSEMLSEYSFSITQPEIQEALLQILDIDKSDSSSRIWSIMTRDHIAMFEIQLRALYSRISEDNNYNSDNTEENYDLSSENLKRLSDDSVPSTIGSNAQISASRSAAILLRHESNVLIVKKDGSNEYTLRPVVQFYFNKYQRGKTYLPNDSQGDHISSYAFIIMSFINTLQNEEAIDEAIDRLRAIGRMLLPELNWPEPFYSSPSRETRNQILESIDGSLFIDGIPGRLIAKQAFIFQKITEKATFLLNLTNSLLVNMQESRDFTAYSHGRLGKKIGEGAMARSSLRGLMALDKLCFISLLRDSDRFEAEISYLLTGLSSGKTTKEENSFSENKDEIDEDGQDGQIMRYGINAWFRDGGEAASSLQNDLMNANDIEIKRELLDRFIVKMKENNTTNKTISAFIGNLFDYDRVLRFDAQKAFPLTKRDVNLLQESINDESKSAKDMQRTLKQKLLDKVSTQFSDEFNFNSIDISKVSYNSDTDQITGSLALIRVNTDKLSMMLSKHLGISDIVCANIVKHSDMRINYIKSKDDFISDTVLEACGWSQLINIHALKEKMKNNQPTFMERDI